MAAKKKKSVKKVATKKADRTIRLALTESVVSQKYTDHEIREAVLKEFPDARLSVTDVRNARDQLNNGDRAKLGFPKPKKPYEKLYRVDKKLVPESQAPGHPPIPGAKADKGLIGRQTVAAEHHWRVDTNVMESQCPGVIHQNPSYAHQDDDDGRRQSNPTVPAQ
jgi:hypothetical protein